MHTHEGVANANHHGARDRSSRVRAAAARTLEQELDGIRTGQHEPRNLRCGHDRQVFAKCWLKIRQRGTHFRQKALTLVQMQTFQVCEQLCKGIVDGE